MVDFLENLKPKKEVKEPFNKKVLCIIEGDLEFCYIAKIFNLFGYTKGCYLLSNELIKVAWGDAFPRHINIVNEKCKFQGGSLKGRRVPFPAIDAFELYSRDLAVFDSVIVLFDGDKDKKSEVENYFKEAFKKLELDSALVVSIPCFESTLIDFCSCGKCRKTIDSIEDEKYPCDKYKNNFSKLECFEGVKNLIKNLNQKKIENLNSSKLIEVNQIIQNYMSKI